MSKKVSKIVFDAERMKYPFTGLYFYCLHLGSTILQSKPDNMELSFYKNKKTPPVFGEDQQYVAQLSLHKLFKPRWPNNSVYHANYQLSRYIPHAKNIKVLLTVHDLNFISEGKSEKKISRYLNKLQNNIDRASEVVAISNYVKADIEKYCDLKGKRVTVIYNGCTIDEKQVALASDESPLAAPYLFTIGTIARKKNFHVLPYLLKHNQYHLVITGITQDEGYLAEIKQIVTELGLQDRVHFTGAIGEEEKFSYLKHCVLFVFPSLAEGFGLPVIEAMYFGKKTLLSKYTSLPEVGGDESFYLEKTDNVYLEEFGRSQLIEIIDSPSRESEIKTWAQRFTWEQAAQEYLKLYLKLTK